MNPKVGLLVVDPADNGRYIQVRGDAELATDGALGHLDELTRRHTGHPRYYGGRETGVICRIHARRIRVDAIHA
ncbi:MAG: pyridoxamine 5'-phosphate oxidase family protein [Ilumatobacter sp.]|uniref:pyridoxamine 5'-phosphate oxidase family protein n=1 Tax=Ilumatobacter sp. TaxID=1967498 RepID=UPI002624FC55|nr:pyridoxamine 5'-phosphate oxidase family protein [Ilumatobacter sp.]MDJ0770964.1 pyridoxamine 5'-phosphate oxidase family protein [Ilumatobacter sp.]